MKEYSLAYRLLLIAIASFSCSSLGTIQANTINEFLYAPTFWPAFRVTTDEPVYSEAPSGRLFIDSANPGFAAAGSVFDPDGARGLGNPSNTRAVDISGAAITMVGGLPVLHLSLLPVPTDGDQLLVLGRNSNYPGIGGGQSTTSTYGLPGLVNHYSTGTWVPFGNVPDAASSSLLLTMSILALGIVRRRWQD